MPQDPAAALNPALRIGTQLMEVLEAHGFGSGRSERRERIAEMMREVALPDAPAYLKRYPHELSGGQQQRIGLAMAFACRPRVIVLDEPTTGLDVTTQAHVLGTVRELAALHGTAALYVSHDLAVVGTLAARVAVMYAGRIVELGSAEELFRSAAHPYTRRLVAAIPHLSGRRALVGIPGRAPSPGNRPAGCFFAPRCAFVQPACEVALPDLRMVGDGHSVRCVRAEEVRVQAAPASARADDLAAADAGEPVLALRGVHAGYGDLTVVHDVNLEVSPRECLALVGESGSGKTTLARSIAGLHQQRTGEILLRGDAARGELAGPAARGAARHPVHLPEPVRLAQPAADGGADRAPAARPLRRRRQPGRAGRRDARARRAQRRLRRPLSRPALRRRAAAGRDRAGAGLGARPCSSATR